MSENRKSELPVWRERRTGGPVRFEMSDTREE